MRHSFPGLLVCEGWIALEVAAKWLASSPYIIRREYRYLRKSGIQLCTSHTARSCGRHIGLGENWNPGAYLGGR